MKISFITIFIALLVSSSTVADTAHKQSSNNTQAEENHGKTGFFSWLPKELKTHDEKSQAIADSNSIAQTSQGLTETPDWLQDIHNNLEEYSSLINNPDTKVNIDSLTITDWLNNLKTANLKIDQNIHSISTRLENVKEQLKSLGAYIEDEAPDVTKKRNLLHKEMVALTASEKYSQFIIIRIQEIEQRLHAIEKTQIKDTIFKRQPPLPELILSANKNNNFNLNSITRALYSSIKDIPRDLIEQ